MSAVDKNFREPRFESSYDRDFLIFRTVTEPLLTMMLQLLCFLLFLLAALANALDLKGTIIPNTYLASAAALPPGTLLLLTSENLFYKTHPSPTGAFTFHNVTVGPSYLLQVECLSHSFPRLRVDTGGEEVEVYETSQSHSWSHRGAKLSYPIQLFASSQADYYIVYNVLFLMTNDSHGPDSSLMHY